MGVSLVRGITLFVILIAVIFFLAAPPASAQVPNGLKISTILVNNQNVFDESDTLENGLFYTSANFLHVKTRNRVIKQQLLFREGDSYSQRDIEESERILRSNKYIREAHIDAMQQGDEVVVYVITSDTWSTKPTFSFGRVGGKNKSEIGIEEENFLGRGINLGISYRKDIDRNSSNFRIVDKHLFNSRYRLELQHSNLSDGKFNLISLDKPFYSLNSHESHGVMYREESKTDSRYFEGNSYFSWDEQEKEADMFTGWSNGLSKGNVWRHNLGLHLYENRALVSATQPDVNNPQIQEYLSDFTLPEERVEVYPYYSLEFLQDRYDTTINQDKISRTEDRYLGTQFGFQLGLVNKALGSSDNYIRLESYATKHAQLSDNIFSLAGFTVDFEYAPEKTELSNALLNYYARLYVTQTQNFRFYADFTGLKAYKLRYNRQLFLDDDVGFRGYPLRFLSGDSAQKITLEQRYFCDKDLWRIFSFGAAVFFDIGNIKGGTSFEREQSGIYKTVGIGLRIASNRSSRGDIIHIDLAKPLDGSEGVNNLQLTITSRATF